MSRTDFKSKSSETNDPSYDTDGDWYNQKKQAMALDDIEKNFNSSTADPGFENDAIEEAKRRGNTADPMPRTLNPAEKSKPSATERLGNIAKRVVFKGMLKGKSSLVAIILTLAFGGGSAIVFTSPFLAPLMAKEVLSADLNDQLAAVTERSAVMLRTKLKTTTNGCGVVKVACRFSTMTDRQAAKYERAGITVERDMDSGIGKNRGRITSMSFVDDQNRNVTITNPEELRQYTNNNVRFRAMNLKAFNAKFKSLSDTVALKSFAALKTNKAQKITGDTDEDRQRSVNDAARGVTSPEVNNLRAATDRDGNPTGELVDENNQTFTQQDVDNAQQSSSRIAASAGTKAVLKSALLGVGIVGAADSACTVYNTSRMVAALSKVQKKAQAARFAMAMILTPADSIKAGEATEGLAEFVGANLNTTDTTKEVVDESRWSESGSAANPPMIANPEYGKNGFDAPGYKIPAHGDVPTLNARSQRFMIGGGLAGTLDSINRAIAFIINGGNSDPKQVGAKCKIIQNPAVRIASLGIGIIAGLGTVGLFQVASITGSVALALALPYLEANLAEIVAGNMFDDLKGADTMDAGFVGTSAVMGEVAMNRGMKPADATEATEYAALNRKTNENIASAERYMAKATPFDIYNEYSFLGSLARSVAPFTQQNATVASFASNVGALMPAAISTIASPVKAASIERFKKCPDPLYQSIGIEADVFCNVRYVMSAEELAMDPVVNANWMASTGNINQDSESGDPADNGQDWNYVKFLKECTGRTTGWGEDQDENEGDGGRCRADETEAVNKHFRVYTMDAGIDVSMDEEPVTNALPGTTGFDSGETGAVSATGWAFPTVPEAIVTSGYETPERPTHHGLDVALKSSDINGAMGKPIFAARDGKVVAAGPASGFGNWIVIEHSIDGQRVDTVYGHMYDDGVLVKQGDTVKAGQLIGKIGSNGQSSGAHLHYEIWQGGRFDGRSIDPTTLFEGSRPGASPAPPTTDRSRDV